MRIVLEGFSFRTAIVEAAACQGQGAVVKVQLSDHLDFDEIVTAIDDAERRVREAVPIARVIYLEPDHQPTGPAATAGDADRAT